MKEILENQKIAYKIFNNTIQKNKLSHAYIIETNKYKYSEIFVLDIVNNILSSGNDINNKDLIDACTHPDFKILSTENLTYKKNELVKFKEDFKTKPITGKYKIYMIKEADKLNSNLSNTLLKLIEEPEDGIIIFLLVENRYQLLKTILSRCQIVSLREMKENKDLKSFYSYHNYSLDNIELDIKNILSFVVSIERNKINTLLYENTFILDNFKSKEEIKKVLEVMKLIYVDSLKVKNLIDISYFNDKKDLIKVISNINTNEKIINKINIIINNINKLNYNVNLNLFLDKLIIELGGV